MDLCAVRIVFALGVVPDIGLIAGNGNKLGVVQEWFIGRSWSVMERMEYPLSLYICFNSSGVLFPSERVLWLCRFALYCFLKGEIK